MAYAALVPPAAKLRAITPGADRRIPVASRTQFRSCPLLPRNGGIPTSAKLRLQRVGYVMLVPINATVDRRLFHAFARCKGGFTNPRACEGCSYRRPGKRHSAGSRPPCRRPALKPGSLVELAREGSKVLPPGGSSPPGGSFGEQAEVGSPQGFSRSPRSRSEGPAAPGSRPGARSP